jgi:predicted ArsR family transcriptional regulator
VSRLDISVNSSKLKPKYRRPLNETQIEVLRLLYWLRFGTCGQIAKYLEKTDIKQVQKKLKILEDQGCISKRYEKSYKLRGRPAEYYLTPKGGRLLQAYDRKDTKPSPTKEITDLSGSQYNQHLVYSRIGLIC